MLSEKIYEGKGKITGNRVLPSEGSVFRVETTFQGEGKLRGLKATEMGTYWAAPRPGGFLYGEGQGFLMVGKDVVTWTGTGIGRFTGKGSSVRWRGSLFYQTASRKLVALNGAIGVFEYETDENGNSQSTVWEWK